MRDETEEGVLLMPRAVRNAHLVREVDPRSSRDLWALLLVVAALVAGLGLYAWPHLAVRQTGIATDKLYRERERLTEENRKLRLEKASLEDLKRVEAIAIRELGLRAPRPETVIVVERPLPVPAGARLAQGKAPREETRN